jgi:hypothetical protein
MNWISLVLLICGMAVSFTAIVWLVASAFRESLWWGLGALCVPGFALVFLVYKWPVGKGPLLAALTGSMLILGCYPSVRRTDGPTLSWADLPQNWKAWLTDPGKPGLPTPAQIDQRRAALARREIQLRERRAKTPAGDSAAMARLTLQIRDYNRDLARFQADVARLAAATRVTTPEALPGKAHAEPPEAAPGILPGIHDLARRPQ